MINKNLILTFFIVILAITLLKNREQFGEKCTGKIKGCEISNLANPSPGEIYNCLIKQCNSIIGEFGKLKNKSSQQQYSLIDKILVQQKNYFIMLYMNNLEKYYKGIIFIATAPYMGTDKTPNSVVQIEIPDMTYFMHESHKTSNKYKLIKNKIYPKSGINTINQIGYLLVPPGFKMALSSPDNNKYGRKCTNKLRYPNSSSGSCIPGNLRNFNSYLTGKHNIRSLMYHFSRTNRPTIVWRRGPLWLNERDGTYWGRGRGNRGEYQKDFNWHTQIDSSMGSCWLGTGKPASVCHYAYGNIIFKHINVIADENFFNKFYATPSKREEIRNQFRMGNFNSLKGFF